jgi:hypothetical protein
MDDQFASGIERPQGALLVFTHPTRESDGVGNENGCELSL